MFRALGLKYRMKYPPVIVPTAIVTIDVIPVYIEALEDDFLY